MDDLDAVLIGGRERRPIVLARHDPRWTHGSDEVRCTLAFGDRPRVDPADRELYERVKGELAARDWADANEYAQAKTGVVEAILPRADRDHP